MKQYQLPSWFWRVITGFLLGGALSWILLLVVAEGKTFDPYIPGVANAIATVFFPPILGIFAIFSGIETAKMNAGGEALSSSFAAFLTILATLFYPAVFALLFYLGGGKQKRSIVVAEVLIVIAVGTLGIFGAFSW